MEDWGQADEEEVRQGFDTHVVTWSAGLTQFPDQALFPNKLVVLDLRYNKISRFPANMELLTNLQHLDLTHNRVESIPDDICLWQGLRGLFMGANRLEALPSKLGLISSLQILRLDHNRLVELPWELGSLPNLQVLGLEHNRLTSLPPELARIPGLHLLSLSGNPMIPPSGSRTRQAAPSAVNEPRTNSFLPDESEADRGHATGKPSMNRQAHDSLLAHMASQLLYQDLSYRDFQDIPDSVLRTTSLQALVMSNNRLEVLPPELGALTSLRVLDVSNNLVAAIPNAFSSLVKLKEINLASNRLRNTTRETHQAEETCIPVEIGYALTALETLLLLQNQLKWVPPAVTLFPLVRLDLSRNALVYLPELRSSMPMVQTLRMLVLSNNKLREISGDSLAMLTGLEELLIECNMISQLPFALGALDRLTLLWAGQNRIEGVPTSLGRLTNLRSLRLEKNLISFLPVELGKLSKIEDMNLFNNASLYQPPPDVVVRGCKHVIAYLQRLYQHHAMHARNANSKDVFIFDDELDAAPVVLDDSTSLDLEGEGDEPAAAGSADAGPGADAPEEEERAVMTDANGEAYLPAGSVTRPKHPVMYLNQEADLLRVYCEDDRVFCDLRLVESGKTLTRIPEHAIA